MFYKQTKLPREYREEYHFIQTALFKKRVDLHCLLASALFLLVCLQYYLRYALLHQDTFRPQEVWIWCGFPILVTAVLFINRAAKTMGQHRLVAHIFNFVFLTEMGALAVIYPETATVFPFYYAFTLLIMSFMMPWRLRDFTLLTAITIAIYTFFYFYVSYGMNRPIENFPRFHAYWDGLIFIGLAYVIGFVIKKNDIERDIKNFILLKEVDEQNKQIEGELDLAKRVHRTLIPESIKTDKANVDVTYIPMGKVGGDYAKFRFIDDERLIFFMSDVTGHGVPAALLVNRLHAEFERLARENKTPGALMRELNHFIYRDFDGTYMYLSAFCGVLNFKTMKFSYSNYGHPTQYLYRYKNPSIQNLISQAGLLGVTLSDLQTELYENEIPFEKGDHLLLFTDGVTEVADKNGEFYGEQRVVEFIRKSGTQKNFSEELMKELRAFSNGSFNDDIFILNIQTSA